MNRLSVILLFLLASCHSNVNKEPVVSKQAGLAVHRENNGNKKEIDLDSSLVKWKGTKLMGTGSHSGTVKFSNGYLEFDDGMLTGGELVVDMSTIYNTDIPLSDPVPRKNLTGHLHEDFATSEFPTSTFKILSATRTTNGYQVTGQLTIRGISRDINAEVTGSRNATRYTCQLSIDRHNWNIGENGSWLEQKLVDAEVLLDISIYLKR